MARIGPCNSDHRDGCCCTEDRNELAAKLKLFESDYEAEFCECAKCGHIFSDYSVSVCTVWPDVGKPWWARTVFYKPLCRTCGGGMSSDERRTWELSHQDTPHYTMMGAWTREHKRIEGAPKILRMSRTRTLFRGMYSGCNDEIRRMGDIWMREPPWDGVA